MPAAVTQHLLTLLAHGDYARREQALELLQGLGGAGYAALFEALPEPDWSRPMALGWRQWAWLGALAAAPAGCHPAVARRATLERLRLRRVRSAHLPPGLDRFPRLRALVLLGSGLDSVGPAFAAVLPQLRHLGLVGCWMGDWPEALQDLPRLERLDLSGTRIRRPPAGFPGLTGLRHLVLKGASSRGLDDLSGLEQLETLDLRGSYRTRFPGLAGLTRLRSLALGQPQLRTALPAGTLAGLPALRSLSLVGFRLPPGALDAQLAHGQLEELELAGQQLERWPARFWQQPRLRRLLLSGHRMATLPEALAGCAALRELRLKALPLLAVPAALGRLEQLEQLEIASSHTRLPRWGADLVALQQLHSLQLSRVCGRVPPGVSQLRRLKRLELKEDPSGGFALSDPGLWDLQRLERLSLSLLGLRALPPGIESLSRLRWLDLSGNRLQAVPDGVWALPRLRHLTLSRNRIRDPLPGRWRLRLLRSLDLSHNPIADPKRAEELLETAARGSGRRLRLVLPRSESTGEPRLRLR